MIEFNRAGRLCLSLKQAFICVCVSMCVFVICICMFSTEEHYNSVDTSFIDADSILIK